MEKMGKTIVVFLKLSQEEPTEEKGWRIVGRCRNL